MNFIQLRKFDVKSPSAFQTTAMLMIFQGNVETVRSFWHGKMKDFFIVHHVIQNPINGGPADGRIIVVKIAVNIIGRRMIQTDQRFQDCRFLNGILYDTPS